MRKQSERKLGEKFAIFQRLTLSLLRELAKTGGDSAKHSSKFGICSVFAAKTCENRRRLGKTLKQAPRFALALLCLCCDNLRKRKT